MSRLKKGICITCVAGWLLLCGGQIYSKTKPLEFEIHYDSNTNKTYEVKKQVQEIFDDLVSGLHTSSQATMVIHNIAQFETIENMKAEWKDKLVLTQGDGDGAFVEGELTQSSYCMEKVQPRSLLQQLFGGED